MLENIKEMILEKPEHIENILDVFEFCNITKNNREIRCARSEFGNKSSIRI